MNTSSNILQAHLPCDKCGSSDALTIYDDNHSFCFACSTHTKSIDSILPTTSTPTTINSSLLNLDTLLITHLKARGITRDTCQKFSYYIAKNRPLQIAVYHDDKGNPIAQKIRTKTKEFYIKGDIQNRFYGQHLWQNGGKKLVITEGEIDCLTVSQVQQNKYPVVSLPNGAKSAARTFKKQLEWLEKFEEVIVMFDNDTAGQTAVDDVKGILSPSKLKIATLPFKDPNECLLNNKPDLIVSAIWNAKTYTPDGIINAKDLWETLTTEDPEMETFNYPWFIDLEQMTMGIRVGEMIMLTAGTGVGKSTIARKIIYHLGKTLNVKVGLMMLEENIKRTAKDIMADYAEERLRMTWHTLDKEKQKEIFDNTLGTGNFVLYDHFGSIEGDNLIKKMRYMIAEGCRFIILDHISIAIAGLDNSDERRTIDKLITQLRSLIEETGIGMIVISHLRKNENGTTTHEEGGTITLDQLRGSGTLKQTPDTIIAAERNQQAEGIEKNVLRLRLLKCRFTGETGIAGYLLYNKDKDSLEPYYPSEHNNSLDEEPLGTSEF